MTDNVSTEKRLQRALSQLIDQHTADRTPGTLTAKALCQLAGVSRTTLYRYHPGVLQSLHECQRKHLGKAGPDSQSLIALREERAALRTQVKQLAALVDHYFAAWSESQILLKRREGELAAIRRRTKPTLASVRIEPLPHPQK